MTALRERSMTAVLSVSIENVDGQRRYLSLVKREDKARLSTHQTMSRRSSPIHTCTGHKYMNRFNENKCTETKLVALLMAGTLAGTYVAASGALAAGLGSRSQELYIAHLHPMNSVVTGLQTTGEAKFSVIGDKLTISIKARGLPPNIVHWQHFHGFADNRTATCPSATADTNGDGIIDLIETEPTSGTTMVPFTDDPVAMDVAHGTYPKASAAGTYTYRQTVSLKGLTAAFAKAFNDQTLDLDRRVVFIHGVVPASKLPASVASLGPIPADVTLPIACGRIERIKQ